MTGAGKRPGLLSKLGDWFEDRFRGVLEQLRYPEYDPASIAEMLQREGESAAADGSAGEPMRATDQGQARAPRGRSPGDMA